MTVDEKTEVYRYKTLTFILLNSDIIIRTSLGQTFFLLPREYWRSNFNSRRMATIRNKIRCSKIKSLNDLASYTRPGIIWSHTSVIYDISKCHIKEIND